MSTVTAGPDIIPPIDNELDHTCTDTPSFISHFRATMCPAKMVLMYEIAFNMMVVIKSFFNANHLLAIFLV